ncbi:MAG: cobalamin-dependent protein [Clostridia bacterium]|nr:cobalamin-dependent protein [Clostridia bacterium]
MKNVFFVQIIVDYGKTMYLPYAAGTIIANCMQFPEITSEFAFPDILFKREKLNTSLEKIKDPFMVAFSCNIWNIEYNKALAKLVKEKYPECIIVFGGHSAGQDGKLLNEESYIDIIVQGEGETVFAELLKKIPAGKLENVNSIAYRKNGQIVVTPKSCKEDLSKLPSPYTAGVFDLIVEKYKDYQLDVIIETNRGCPYSCAYCEWSDSRKLRLFPIEKIRDEILWCARNKMEYILCADSNFGLLKRDLEIVDILVETKKKYGYPKVFRVDNEKNSEDRVFEICKKLNKNGMDKGVTISFQTMSPVALENIGRKNLTLDHFSGLIKRYTQAGIPTYSELILGLPGETFESFSRGICSLLEKGNNNTICVYPCEILPNALMADPEYRKKYKIETVKVKYRNFHAVAHSSEEVEEYSELVRSTYSMSRDDWVKTHLFSACSLGFHAFPLLRLVAFYLYNEKKTDYFRFYSGLVDYLLSLPGLIGDIWRDMKYRLDNSLKDGKVYSASRIGNTYWTFEEGAFLQAVRDLNLTFKEILPYLKQFDIETNVFEDLIEYQKAMVRDANGKTNTVSLRYDFPEYFSNILIANYQPLKERKTIIKISPDRTFEDFETYAREIVWYGRRNEAAIYKKHEITITYE